MIKRQKNLGMLTLGTLPNISGTSLTITLDKRDFILEELRSNENNAKKFWKTVQKVVPSGKSSPNHDILLKDENGRIDRSEVAHFMNNYFINNPNQVQ